MGVAVQGVLVIIRRILTCAFALEQVPAVVFTGLYLVDFFKKFAANVANKQPVRAGLNREGKGIAESHGVNGPVYARILVVKRIVLRNRAIGIQAQDFAQQALQTVGCYSAAAVAHSQVEFPVGAESHGARVMHIGNQRIEFK